MATQPSNLSDYILLTETIRLTGTGLTGGLPYRTINRNGIIPIGANGSDAVGPIIDVRNGQATVATEGIAIVELSNSSNFTVAVGSPLRSDANGQFIVCAVNERAMGIAMDAETSTNGGTIKYVRMKLSTFTV